MRGKLTTRLLVLGAALLWAAPSSADNMRAEITGGYSASLFQENESEPLEGTLLSATLEDIDTGAGPVAGAALWFDGFLGDDTTAGIEYAYSGFKPDATVRVATPGASTTITDETDATVHSVFLNAAWRTGEGRWHPYAGGGLGLGYAKLDVDNRLVSGKVDSVVGGLQAFVGVDYDVTEDVYVGAGARLYYIDGRVIGLDLQFLELQVLGKLGLNF